MELKIDPNGIWYHGSNMLLSELREGSTITQWKELAEAGASVHIGECGCYDKVDNETALAWYKDMNSALEKYGIPRAAWSHHSMNFGLADPWLDSVREELVKYL